MKNSILLKVLTLAGAMLLASGGWGFETDKNSLIKGDLTVDPSGSVETTTGPGNLTVKGTLKVGTVNNASVPRGVIVMWHGAVNAIPAGWALCNGNNNTPDLQGKFVVGYKPLGQNEPSSDYTYEEIGDQGGNDSLILTEDQMPSHSHLYVGAGSYGADDPGSGSQMADNTPGSTEPTGRGLPFDNRPAYFVVAYIMKL